MHEALNPCSVRKWWVDRTDCMSLQNTMVLPPALPPSSAFSSGSAEREKTRVCCCFLIDLIDY
jgi:hypothetical protein